MKLLAYLLIGLLLLPVVLSVLVSFTPSRFLELPRAEWTLRWYGQFFDDSMWLQALGNSLLIAVLTALLSVSTALATALAMLRNHFRWKRVCEGGILLPMVLPNIALAAGMLALVRVTPLWGSHLSLAMAHSVLAIPVAYLVLRA